MSTAFHLQTNSQTDRINQTIETFLRSLANLPQTDRVELMPLAECAYNNSVPSAHIITPFYATYGYPLSSGTAPTETNILSASSVAYGHWMQAVYEDCKQEFKKSRE
jgi:hypothetical protein